MIFWESQEDNRFSYSKKILFKFDTTNEHHTRLSSKIVERVRDLMLKG